MDYTNIKSCLIFCSIFVTLFCRSEADFVIMQELKQKYPRWDTSAYITPETQQSYHIFQQSFKGTLQTLFEMVEKVDTDLHDLVNKRMQGSLTINKVSFTCINDTEMILEGLSTHQAYAVRFLDADAKPPSGILQGQMLWTGNYHECLTTESPFNIHTGHKFKGKYFTVDVLSESIQKLAPQGVLLGVCLPDSCSKEGAQSLINIAFSTILSTNQTVVPIAFSTEPPPIDNSSIMAMSICGVVFTLILLGTFIDYFQQWNESRRNLKMKNSFGYQDIDTENSYDVSNSDKHERHGLLSGTDFMVNNNTETTSLTKFMACLKTFSLFANTKKLVNTSTASGPLACLNGLRVISMFWVIQGHTYSFSQLVMKDINYARTTLYHRFSFQPIANGTYSVDTFFFLSGLLVAFLALKELTTKGKLNWVYYFLHRYWRLTPIYAFCIMCFTTVFTLMLSGPFVFLALDPKGPLYNSWNECRTKWWSNLLYINNFYPDYGSTLNCFGWAWYLANDMQFYIFLSPLVIILLHKNQKVGIAFCVFLIAACIASRAFIVHYYGLSLSGTVSKHKDDPWSTTSLYIKPYCRWSVYIVGMLTGYLLQATKCKARLNIFFTLIGWAISMSMGLAVIYGLYHNYKTGDEMSETGTIFYVSCARTAWSLSLAWLVFACAVGKGGWINHILSWKLWAPLGRLTYGAYLIHPMVLVAFYLTMVEPIPFTDLNYVYLFVTNVVLSYGLAYIISMAVEAPMLQLEKLILGRS